MSERLFVRLHEDVVLAGHQADESNWQDKPSLARTESPTRSGIGGIGAPVEPPRAARRQTGSQLNTSPERSSPRNDAFSAGIA